MSQGPNASSEALSNAMQRVRGAVETFVQTYLSRASEGHMERRKFLVAVSGGVDSMVLLKALADCAKKHPIDLAVFHLNHLFRGDASDRDAALTEALAKALGLVCFSYRRPVEAMAKAYGMGFEEMGRRLRYQLMDTLCLTQGFSGVYTAHHADDQAETVLLHALRGSGLKGLTGIHPNQQGRLRPLLLVEKSDLVAAASAWALPYGEDATNFDVHYKRNALRLDVFPLLEAHFGTRVRLQLAEMATVLREDEDYLEQETLAILKAHLKAEGIASTFSTAQLRALPLGMQRRVVIAMIHALTGTKKDISRQSVDYWLTWFNKGLVGSVHRYRGIHFELRQQVLRLIPLKDYPEVAPTAVYRLKSGANMCPEWGLEVTLGLVAPGDLSDAALKDPNTLVLPLALATGGLVLRARVEGERMAPEGLQGHTKSLKKILSELDIASDEKRMLPVIATDLGQVVWLPGLKKSVFAHAGLTHNDGAVVIKIKPISKDVP